MIRRPLPAGKYSASSTSASGLAGSPSLSSQWKAKRGFSLIELLVVMGILAVLMIALLPKIGSIGSSQSITQAYGAIPDLLRQARSYAMANNTYVYVGIDQGTGANSDKVIVGIVATKDGTSGISGSGFKNSSTDLTPLQRLQAFDGVKMDTSLNSKLSALVDSQGNRLMDAQGKYLTDSGTTFGVDVISNVDPAPLDIFRKVIQFSPSGTASLATIGTTQTLQSSIQASFKPAHGSDSNSFGVQVDGLTGAVRAFRPDVNL